MDARRRILITGASRGVGRALAEHYVRAGNAVAGCSRQASSLNTPNYSHYSIDITSEAAVKELFAGLSSNGAPVEVLINNAGVALSRLSILTSAIEADRILRTNFTGAFLVIREAIKMMKRNRFGRIINFSSINVPLGSTGSAIYSASKAALEHLAFTLSREVATDDITINTIGLSLVAGEGMAAALSVDALREKQASLIKPKPLQIEEIVHAIDFFASEFSGNITNQVLYFGGVR